MTDAWDLINRQKEEIELLRNFDAVNREYVKICDKEISELNAELEAKKENYENLKTEHLDLIRTLKHYKSEAYKEFAERLKKDIGEALRESVKTRGRSGFFFAKDVPYHIDYLLAELTKGDEGK